MPMHLEPAESESARLIRQAIAEARTSLGETTHAELEGLEEALVGLANGDLADLSTEDVPATHLARAVRATAEALAHRLEPIAAAKTGLGEAALRLDDTGEIAKESHAMLDTTLAEIGANHRKVAPRLAEVTEVAQRLEEVAAQASVAALNVSVEVSRGDEASVGTLSTLAEEVRRLADRTGTATRRLTELILEIDEASSSSGAGLERARQRSGRCAENHRLARELVEQLQSYQEELSKALSLFHLPADRRVTVLAARLTSLRHDLADELSSLSWCGADVPAEVATAIDELSDLLRNTRLPTEERG